MIATFKRHTHIVMTTIAVIVISLFTSCQNQPTQDEYSMATPEVEVITLRQDSITTYKQYPASIEGRNNIEIRPQISGYIQKVFVNEGQFVKVGTTLFKIHDQPYVEQKNQALAALQMAKSQLLNAELDLDKYQNLTSLQVSSDFQFKKAKAAYESALSQVKMQEALLASADVNLSFSVVKAPVSGYVGRIPRKTGALVSPSDVAPMTTLSEIEQVYAYFSMNENDVLQIDTQTEGSTIIEKLRSFNDIELQLANGAKYPIRGAIDMVDGQYNMQTAALTLRATFANPSHLLRTGNTAKVILKTLEQDVFKIPLLATYELQDKLIVGRLKDNNEVEYVALEDYYKSGDFYIVKKGFKNGDKIIAQELSRIPEQTIVTITSSK